MNKNKNKNEYENDNKFAHNNYQSIKYDEDSDKVLFPNDNFKNIYNDEDTAFKYLSDIPDLNNSFINSEYIISDRENII